MTDRHMAAAARWCERLEDSDEAVRRQFDAWRAEPANDEAWQAVRFARDLGVALADHPVLLDLRSATRTRVERERSARRPVLRWALGAGGMIAASLLCVLAFGHVGWPGSRAGGSAPAAVAESRFQTAPGQQLAVLLPDGSRLTLDTDSQVRTAYSATRRSLVLVRGRALFSVARDPSRPFEVTAGDHVVIAHGTRFDVRLEPSSMRVALVEGKVTVRPARTRRSAVAMVPDDVLLATPAGISLRHQPGSAQQLTSWSEGRLIFENETLARAVAEMNRYGGQPIAIADARAGSIRISGSFRSGAVGPFLDALQVGFPVRIRHTPDGTATIASR